jgi:formamidopyrimidine-DNA glycosylase
MPELPEIETIRRELRPKIIGQKITGCRVLRDDVIGFPSPKRFCKLITNQKIVDVKRKAKYLLLPLTGHQTLIFHLRLSGSIALRKNNARPERFTRIIIKFSNYQLFFNEPRALGRVYVIKDGALKGIPKGLLYLGCEPISSAFDFDYFRGKLKGRRARIKSLLLDQRICAGVGNIYSDEALFHAGIRPLRRANRLTIKETLRLLLSLKDVLCNAIDNFGTSVSDYRRTDGRNGNFQKFLYVYSREGEPCRRCGTKIVVKKIGNRSTRYCPKCQK